ncbi:MAG: CPBP family intramembrane metalloprotease [Candidatus Promineofilum sp.]|nr:CPBP family intramembrane metalloprotease [Promineifilum sp.]MCW5863206.1 CPBP family intramembrane metalloprotease [Anaerolineae bacterium]
MLILLVSLPLLLLILLANWVTARGGAGARTAFNLFLFLTGAILVVGGVGLRFAPALEATLPNADGQMLVRGLGSVALVGMGVWGMVVSLRPARQWLHRSLPALDPDSSVHTLALALVGALAANAIVSSGAGLETLAAAGIEATLLDVLAQGLVFVLAACLGVGLLTRRDTAALTERLGLQRPTAGQLWTGVRWMVFFVFLQGCIGVTWALLSPEQAGQISGITDALLGNFDTVGEWFLLAAAAGLGEEMFFRGALQPIFGIVPTSLIFAVSHVQYGLSPATLTIFLLSIVLGIIRKRSNTTVAILVHGGYNFILGLLSLLAIWAQATLTR